MQNYSIIECSYVDFLPPGSVTIVVYLQNHNFPGVCKFDNTYFQIFSFIAYVEVLDNFEYVLPG